MKCSHFVHVFVVTFLITLIMIMTGYKAINQIISATGNEKCILTLNHLELKSIHHELGI